MQILDIQRNYFFSLLFFSVLLLSTHLLAEVKLGCERLIEAPYTSWIAGKKIGLITNQTGRNSQGVLTLDVLRAQEKKLGCQLAVLFAPEHGLFGEQTAGSHVEDNQYEGITIFSLHGSSQRPSQDILKQIDVLVYDIQDIGSRSYTFANTLFFAMEEAAKAGLTVIVLDRPNPINGLVIDGPMLEDKFKSIVGYLNVPYCHGMTIGELARFFNDECKVGCKLKVVPMKGWKRSMSYSDTGLPWYPTSPNIPEMTTPLYYPMTGILGELQIVSIGIGFTLPFRVVGAPWMDADHFTTQLNAQKFPGVSFIPWHFKPSSGRFASEVCHGCLVMVTDPTRYLPVSTQYLIMGVLKNLYPSQFDSALASSESKWSIFNKVNGTDNVLNILKTSKHIIWPLRELHQPQRDAFKLIRQKYFIYKL